MCVYILCIWAGGSALKICLQCRRPGFDPCVGEISWRGECLLTPVFLSGEFHRQKSLVGYSLWGQKELDIAEPLTHNTHNAYIYTYEQ